MGIIGKIQLMIRSLYIFVHNCRFCFIYLLGFKGRTLNLDPELQC